MTQLKDSFKEYFTELIGANEAEQFFDALSAKNVRRSLRINDLKVSSVDIKEWLISQGYSAEDNPYSKLGIDIEGRGQPLSLKLPYYSGYTYPQDSSSMFSIEVLDPQPGEKVLDLTAAPGGKTTYIAQKMENTGVLIANDLDSRRLKSLHSNLERLGIWNTIVFRAMPHKLVEFYPETFDRILLDPSCSGEGLLVTRNGKPNFWSTKAMKRYRSEQYGLLKSAFRLLKPGGRLVYSTCTLNAIEDDGVVMSLIKDFEEAELEEVEVAGTPEQIGDLKGIRFWPHKTRTKGFFCIAITKKESMGLKTTMIPSHEIRIIKDRKHIERYFEESFGIELPDIELTERDDHIFMISRELARFKLPPKYSLGFPILKRTQSGFRLTHAGALWAGLHAKKNKLELNRDQLEAFFDRQPIGETDLEKGSYLAYYKNFQLGVAKVTDRGIEMTMPRQF